MTKQEFERLNQLSCCIWQDLSIDEQDTLCYNTGIITIIECVANILCITLTDKDIGYVDTICNNILKLGE